MTTINTKQFNITTSDDAGFSNFNSATGGMDKVINAVEIQNPNTGETRIVPDHSQHLFLEGFTKLVRHVPNHEVDFAEMEAQLQEQQLIRMAESASDPYRAKSSDDKSPLSDWKQGNYHMTDVPTIY